MSDPDADARFDALEMRVAYQDDSLEKLHAVMTAQWTQIDRLTRQIAELRDRLQDAESRAPAPAGDAPPPHY